MAASFSAAKLGVPLLLTTPDVLSPETAEILRELSGSPETIHVLGGPVAIRQRTEAAINRVSGAPTDRLAGASRYDTATAIAKFSAGRQTASDYNPDLTEHVYIATGIGFADALGAGPAAATADTVTELRTVDGQHFDRTGSTAIDSLNRIGSANRMTVVGGLAAISQESFDALDRILRGAS